MFHSLAELKSDAGVTLAVIKSSFWLDHYVTVLAVTNNEVVVGDPFLGLCKFSDEDFKRKWRFVGVVLQRRP